MIEIIVREMQTKSIRDSKITLVGVYTIVGGHSRTSWGIVSSYQPITGKGYRNPTTTMRRWREIIRFEHKQGRRQNIFQEAGGATKKKTKISKKYRK